MKWYVLFLCLITFSNTCQSPKNTLGKKGSDDFSPGLPIPENKSPKIDGITLVAPPKPFKTDPMLEIKNAGANWVAVVPYSFSRPGEARLHYNTSKWQWWGETPAGIEQTIKIARENGMQIMVKPQVWIPGGWTGNLDFDRLEDWESWEKGYEKFILEFAHMADQYQAELFCIGTELRQSVKERPQFWKQLTEKVRNQYSGKLVYAANWDDFEAVEFWEQLDYAGINAYFPLIEADNPGISTICKAWQPWIQKIESFYNSTQKPILFTEFGYLSVDRCTWNTWDIEKSMGDFSVNEMAQANALHSLFHSFWEKNYWAGGFLWKWFPDMQGHEGFPEKDYTPQGKLAELVLKRWYGKTEKQQTPLK